MKHIVLLEAENSDSPVIGVLTHISSVKIGSETGYISTTQSKGVKERIQEALSQHFDYDVTLPDNIDECLDKIMNNYVIAEFTIEIEEGEATITMSETWLY